MKTTPSISLEDYFTALGASEQKLEYHKGEMVAMAGAQPNHAKIQANIFGKLFACLEARGCLIMGSDLLVKAGTCGNFYFPDLVIVCGKDLYETVPGGLKALLNPEVIVDILSDNTEALDRTFKFDCYKTIPGFRKYVLVHSTKRQIEIITRLSDVEWLSHTYENPEEEIDLEGCLLSLGDVYKRVEL